MLRDPVQINLERQAAPAAGIMQAVYPVPQELKASLFLELLKRGDIEQALVFTRTKHRADRLARLLVRSGVRAERIHGNRSQPQRTAALAGFKSGRFDVLVATDIAARGIDVVALGHVVNFDVPQAPDDYIHRVGRTGRAEETGDAFTLVAPEEEDDLHAIERAIGKRLPRVTMPDFDYAARPAAAMDRRGRGSGSRSGATRRDAGGHARRSGTRHEPASHARHEAPASRREGGGRHAGSTARESAGTRDASASSRETPKERQFGRRARPAKPKRRL
jgi:ATP-dependent RNA helicase RhlE